MTAYLVSGDQHRQVDLLMAEIKRELSRPEGSRLDPHAVASRLKLIIESAPAAAPAGSTSPAQAAAVMGSAFHGVDALERHLGVGLHANEAALLAAVPFSQQLLEACRDTHILVAGARVSIMDIRAKVPDTFYFKNAWYVEEDFAQHKIKTGWRLIRKDPLPDSTSRTWAEQRALSPAGEFTPRVCEVVLAIILHYLGTGQRLLPAVYVRTNDVASDSRQVGLGRFGSNGLRIRSWGDYPDYYIGLAAARKSSWNRGISAPAAGAGRLRS